MQTYAVLSEEDGAIGRCSNQKGDDGHDRADQGQGKTDSSKVKRPLKSTITIFQ
jgi:hypothetical protein